MLLAESFLDDIAWARGLRGFTLAPLAVGALRAHQWPGDARELRNVLERATVMGGRTTIEADALSLDPASMPRRGGPTDLNSAERSMIERAMRDMEGNISKAARTLGISRTQLYVRLRKYGFNQASI